MRIMHGISIRRERRILITKYSKTSLHPPFTHIYQYNTIIELVLSLCSRKIDLLKPRVYIIFTTTLVMHSLSICLYQTRPLIVKQLLRLLSFTLSVTYIVSV